MLYYMLDCQMLSNKRMKINLAKYYRQAFSFFVISGLGWMIDFSIYAAVTIFFDLNVLTANMLSSIPAITFVFYISTKKTFEQKENTIKLKYKYLIYFTYQIILLVCVSFLGQMMFTYINMVNLTDIPFILNNLKIVVKILITPVTMLMNFIVMKLLIEKL
jgi:putative flippase GtrA